jgi:hypothetical protein
VAGTRTGKLRELIAVVNCRRAFAGRIEARAARLWDVNPHV